MATYIRQMPKTELRGITLSRRVYKTAVISFSVGKMLIKQCLKLEHLASWDTCNGCRQSIKLLMRYPLSSRANELLAVSRLKLRVAVGPPKCRTTLDSSCTNLDTETEQNADCVGKIMKTVSLFGVSMQKIQE